MESTIRGAGSGPGIVPAEQTRREKHLGGTTFREKRHWNQCTAFTGFDRTYTCLSPGMPRIMNIHEPMEIVITADTTHILTQSAGETPAFPPHYPPPQAGEGSEVRQLN